MTTVPNDFSAQFCIIVFLCLRSCSPTRKRIPSYDIITYTVLANISQTIINACFEEMSGTTVQRDLLFPSPRKETDAIDKKPQCVEGKDNGENDDTTTHGINEKIQKTENLEQTLQDCRCGLLSPHSLWQNSGRTGRTNRSQRMSFTIRTVFHLPPLDVTFGLIFFVPFLIPGAKMFRLGVAIPSMWKRFRRLWARFFQFSTENIARFTFTALQNHPSNTFSPAPETDINGAVPKIHCKTIGEGTS